MQHIIEIEYCKKTDYKLQIIIVKAKKCLYLPKFGQTQIKPKPKRLKTQHFGK